MTDDRSKMRDGDMPLLDRIESAMRRVTSGQGQMRVPVEATDPDVVLADCKREIERLREALTAANAQAEHFEREWYLRGDEIERLRTELAKANERCSEWTEIAGEHGAVVDRLRKEIAESEQDAARYRWLRAQHWDTGTLAVVADPKRAVKLGHDLPSLDRLDAAIDDAMLRAREVNE